MKMAQDIVVVMAFHEVANTPSVNTNGGEFIYIYIYTYICTFQLHYLRDDNF
jgi:hypothetical protein